MHGGEAGSKQNFRAFKGPGMALGKHSGEEGSTAAQGVSEAACTEVWAPSSGASMGNTLFRKLPERVIKNGSVVNVREDIRKMVSGSSQSDAGGVQVECVVEDVAMQEQDGDSDERKATLRVKMPSGDRVLELKLSYGSTILEMRMCIEKHLKTGIRYKVRSSFPAKEYTDDSATLEEAGLTPNALLFLTES